MAEFAVVKAECESVDVKEEDPLMITSSSEIGESREADNPAFPDIASKKTKYQCDECEFTAARAANL